MAKRRVIDLEIFRGEDRIGELTGLSDPESDLLIHIALTLGWNYIKAWRTGTKKQSQASTRSGRISGTSKGRTRKADQSASTPPDSITLQSKPDQE